MNVKVEKTENKNEVKMSFVVDAEKFDEAIVKVYNENAKYFTIPGFRKGKAPFKIVERYYGDEMFYQDAFNALVPEIYEKALKDENVDAVSKPDINITKMKKGEDLEFTITVQTRPEVKLGKYKGVSVEKVEHKVTNEDVEHELKHRQEHNARTVAVEGRAVKKGDIANIDFEGFKDGKPFDGGKAEKYDLEIGSNSFIPGFEDQIIGMKVDEEKEINVKFPDDYTAKDLAGKDAMFKVKLHEVKEKKLPKLDDEFAKDVSEFDTLEELKKDIKTKLEKSNEVKVKQETENAVVEAVAKETEIDIPSGMIDAEVDTMIHEFEHQLYYNGLNLDQYLKMLNKTRADLEKDYKVQAEKNVKVGLVLDAVIKAEKLEATDEEVDTKVKELAEGYGRKYEDVKDNEDFKKYAKNSLETQKAIDFLVKNAKIK